MQNFNVDKPIQNFEQDKLNRKSFVENLVNDIHNYKDKESLTIGVYGQWGSGKTSILNLVGTELEKLKYKIIKFNPWNFKEQDELLQCFFKEFYNQLDMVDYNKLFKKLGRFFIRLGSLVGLGKHLPTISPFASIVAPLIKEYGETLNNLTYKKSLDEIKKKISNALSKIEQKIVIFIDDVDRLNDNEICQIFQLVKLVGNFENVVYVLSFDKNVVVSALQNSQKDFAESYLEKIIQVPLNVPEPSFSRIHKVLEEKLNQQCIHLRKFLSHRNGELSFTGFWMQFKTIREVNRFLNIFNFKFNSLKNYVDFHDFCIVTLLEVKYPEVYKFISARRAELCGNYSFYSSSDNDKKQITTLYNSFLETQKTYYNEEDFKFIQESLKFLFPKISQISGFSGYTTYYSHEPKIRGFLHAESNSKYYFQFQENDELYSNNDIDDCIVNYNKEEFNKFIFKLNENNELSSFIPYIYYYFENILTLSRAKEIIGWLLELASSIKKENQDSKIISRDSIAMLDRLFITFLNKYKDSFNIFEYCKNYYLSGSLDILKVEILRSLQNEHGRMYKGQTNKKETPTLTLEQVVELENIIKDELKTFMKTEESFNSYDYKQYFYLLQSIDEKFCEKILEKHLKSADNAFKFIKSFVITGKYLNHEMTKTYEFNIKSVNEIIDSKKLYDLMILDIDKHNNLNEDDNKIYLSYLMSYEKFKSRDDDSSYTEKDMQRYLETKKTK